MDSIPSPPFLFLLPSSQPLCSLVMLHSLTLENLTDCVSAKDASRLQRRHNSSTVYLPPERRSSHRKEWWAALSKRMFYSCPPQRYVRWFLRLWEKILVLLQGDVGSVDLKPLQGSDSHNLEVPALRGAPPLFSNRSRLRWGFQNLPNTPNSDLPFAAARLLIGTPRKRSSHFFHQNLSVKHVLHLSFNHRRSSARESPPERDWSIYNAKVRRHYKLSLELWERKTHLALGWKD